MGHFSLKKHEKIFKIMNNPVFKVIIESKDTYKEQTRHQKPRKSKMTNDEISKLIDSFFSQIDMAKFGHLELR